MRLSCSLLFSAAAFVALAGCDRAGQPDNFNPTEPAPAREVAAADGYGDPGDRVNAVAFWSHPSVNFEGLLFAATDDGVRAYNIETGEALSSANLPDADALAVFYDGEGPTAQGYAVARKNRAYAFIAISNVDRSLAPLAVENAASLGAAFCIGRDTLFELSGDRLVARDIVISAGGVLLQQPRDIATTGPFKFCHVDERSNAVIVIGADGGIRRVDAANGELFGLAFGEAEATASALFLATTAEPQSAPGGAVALLNGGSGVVTLFDLIDGHALGAVKVKATFDLDAIESARSIAAGYGNYGGVYRDGALAFVTNGDGPPIRLVPWNGVLDSLQLPLGENVDPRAPQATDAAESVISIELIEP